MPKFLEDKLKAQYPNDPAAPFKVMNSIGAMKGNKETAKGAEMEKKHKAKKHHKPPMGGPGMIGAGRQPKARGGSFY